MKKYSSNYCTINNNYIININKETKRIKKENLYSTFCVVQNILQRGMPTKPSNFLRNSIGEYKKLNSLRFITTELQVWDNTIKGYNEANDNPALIFYKKILPFELKEYGFITNLIIPEVKIKEITEDNNKEFVNNYVDFYFPQCKLVIEIDGVQHEGELDKIKDKERDIYFKKFGITTLRITAKEIKEYMKGNKTSILEKIESIYDMCKENDEINYNKKTIESDKSEIENIMIYDSIMRFQILLLELLKVGMLNLEEKQWVFNIKNHDVKFPYLIALQDLINWIKNILSLQGNKINNIDFIINEVDNFEKVNNGINVDFSLLKKWDDNCFEEDICFIRGEYFYERNYFKVATAEPIKYKVITELEENSNVENLYMLNKDIFGFDRFNNGQLPIIINALSLQDTIGLLPTGGGKSLCYQLSCLLQPTINFVVVPIKSLMYDQKLNLDKKGIVHTQFINSDQEGEEKEEIINNFANEKYFYTWISPERFQTEGFREQLRKINSNSNIGYAVIDEVHCLSEWGHDFRTSYLNLSKTIKKLCPSAVFLGLTATASKNVLKDILVEFEVEESNVKTIIDYTRPELSFKVIQDCRNINEDKEKNLISLLNTLDQNENVFELNGEKSKCGLIFTPHVNWKYGCYGIMNSLQQNERFKGKVKYYSGEVPKIKKAPIMSESDFNIYKSKVQEEFQNNEFPLLTATKAFGMGVDKGNIRYTIHYGIPGSVESFYQEAGRAGRDKEKANCYILHSKDIIDEEDYNKLFNINTTVEELKVFTEKYKFQSGDILRNLFLAINNNKGVGEECFLTFGIYKYLCLKKKKVISIDDVKALKIKYKNNIVTSDFQSVQKAIYRLSSLGVIEDWTIDGWNNNGKFIIYYGDTDEYSIKTSLESFINKYDSEFSFNKLNSKKYEKYNNMYIREDVPTVLKYIFILIQWNYDNVFYNRRQSQKNLVDLCDSYSEKGEKYFKEVLEGYFRITNETYILDYISNNPNDLEELYNLIFDENNVLKKYEHFKAIKLSLTRFLESYRYNTALNYLSGICGLILKEYDLFTKDRFREAFVSIMEKDEDTQMEIFEKTLSIGERLEKEEKDKLSEILNEFYKDKYKIYERLKDNVSLNYILEEKIQKLTEIGGRILG